MTHPHDIKYDMTMGEFIATLTDEEREANRLTHTYNWSDDSWDLRCWNCDCRPHGVWSNWPCGMEPPSGVAPWAWTIQISPEA